MRGGGASATPKLHRRFENLPLQALLLLQARKLVQAGSILSLQAQHTWRMTTSRVSSAHSTVPGVSAKGEGTGL